MPALAPSFGDERDGLVAYVAQQLDAFRTVAFGLTDEQARSTPTPSALSVGALVKHAAGVSRGWTDRVAHAPEPPPEDPRPFADRVAAYQDEFVMREDETLADVLAGFDAQAEVTLRALGEADPATPVPVPRDLVPPGRRALVGALGRAAPRRGAGPSRRPRRHHPRGGGRRHDVRPARGARGMARDRLGEALEAAGRRLSRR